MSALALKRPSVSLSNGCLSPTLIENSSNSVQNPRKSDYENMRNIALSDESLPTSVANHRNSAGSDIGDLTSGGRISHWAVSFERLLDDPLGVKYFKEFLRLEFSEENILFWEACEELRHVPADDVETLKNRISNIYAKFLSPDSTMSVNIDNEGFQLAEESINSAPHPNIFENQQQQVYTLMRLDSYSRFLVSPLYRQCMISEMEGIDIPMEVPSVWNSFDLDPLGRAKSGSLDGTLNRKNFKKMKGSKRGFFTIKNRIKRHSNREHESASRKSSGDSNELEGASYSLSRSSSLPSQRLEFPDPSRICHVTLWDGSSTVIFAKKEEGVTVADVLGNLCENRGVRLSAVEAFVLAEGGTLGSKQKTPLSMDMAVSMIAAQSIVLERRALFRLDIGPVKTSVTLKSRPEKSIADVLKPILRQYNLRLKDMSVTVSDVDKEVLLDEPVITLDNSTVSVDPKEVQTVESLRSVDATKKSQRMKQSHKARSPDKKETEELIDLMSNLQGKKMNDQRGLISKDNLELPEFLKLKPLNHNANNNSCIFSSYAMKPQTNGHNSCYEVQECYLRIAARGQATLPQMRTRGRVQTDSKRKSYVELDTHPRALNSIKPLSNSSEALKKLINPESVSSEIAKVNHCSVYRINSTHTIDISTYYVAPHGSERNDKNFAKTIVSSATTLPKNRVVFV